MRTHPRHVARLLCLVASSLALPVASAFGAVSWSGVLRDGSGKPIGEATVRLRSKTADRDYAVKTSASGDFAFAGLAATAYELSVEATGSIWRAANPITLKDGDALTSSLQVFSQPPGLRLLPSSEASPQASGGERLSSGEVSS